MFQKRMQTKISFKKKTKSQNLPQIKKFFRYFQNFKISLVAVNGRCPVEKNGRKVRSKLFCHQNFFFFSQHQKFTILVNKIIPPPKQALFLGGGDEKIWPINQEITCAAKNFRCSLRICEKTNLNTFVQTFCYFFASYFTQNDN